MNNSARLACVLCLLGLVHSVPVPRFQHFMVKDNLWNRFDKVIHLFTFSFSFKKENHISSSVSEILRYRQKAYYFI